VTVLRRRRERQRRALAEKPDVDVFEDVSFVESGVKRTGTVVAIEGSMLQVVRRDGEPPIWIDWRAVDVL
jgi:hypothetical protein